MLAGPRDLIRKARTYRKSYGGALHQCGYLAGAAIYALRHNIGRLAEDHVTARRIAEIVATDPLLAIKPAEVDSNMVIVDLTQTGLPADAAASAARKRGVLVMPIGESKVRFVTHLGVTIADASAAAVTFLDVLAEERLARTEHTAVAADSD